MVTWFNYTDPLGIIISYITINITGSEFLTYTIFLMLIMAFLFIARIPLEIQVLFTAPFVLVLGAYSSSLILFAGLTGLYLAFVFIQFLLSKV